VKWWLINRIKQTDKKQVPINTWKPWKPVAIKKVDPYTQSDIVKLACLYSNTWNPVKNTASIIVKISPRIAP
jgi:hypothetical protein